MVSVWVPEARMQPFGWFSPYGHGFDPDPDLAPLQRRPRWWGPDAEQAFRESIRQWQWAWHHQFASWFVANVSPRVGQAGEYAAAKAKELGLFEGIRLPNVRKACLHCGALFREDGVAGSCLARFGDVVSIDYCNPCMLGVVGGQPPGVSRDWSQEQILDWLRAAAEGLERIPSQAFPMIEEFRAAGRDERRQIVTLCNRRPTVDRVKQLFGSWFGALLAAGLLADGSRRLMRGTHCLARDGHVCFSLGEKTIDDFLTGMGVEHVKEPRYPASNLRADFRIGDTFVEFLGLKGDPDYDEKTANKRRLCAEAGIRLILIEAKDLASRTRLRRRLAIAVPPSSPPTARPPDRITEKAAEEDD